MIGSITKASLRRIVSAASIVGLVAIVASGGVQAQQAVPQSAAVSPGGQAGQSPDYRLGPGDRLRIIVFGQKDMTGEFAVDGTGLLSFPLIGQIKAGGLTAEGLEREITNKLKPDYLRDPKVSVVVLTYRPFYIVGEVKTPGSYAYVTGMSVINAVALAGGFTYRAKESSFYLDRTGRDGKKSRIDAGPDTQVQPGDVITVRERYF
ncbi:MAG TPA: polysaccharide biosynthesis/export family protein [Alphaproteobacteria bacterium]|nr:polysaccharide biosynthesis/export family protein [Alphaproteobacteria bacterium]